MQKESEYLLSLMGDFLAGREPSCLSDVDWNTLVKLSQIHCVTGILGYLVMQYPICPDESLRNALRTGCLQTISLYTRRGLQMDQLIGELDRAGIRHILMKGYVLKDYYPVPELRTYGDIDFVIAPEDRKKCHDLMLSLGFQVKTDWEPVYSYIRGQEFYEIHRDIMEVDVSDKADYRGYFARMWEHTLAVQENTLHFTPEFHLLYLLTHIAKHIRGSGAGIRMYLDIGVFLRAKGEELDWEWIFRELKVLKLYDFARVVFTATEQWFGVKCPVDFPVVENAVMAEFREYTLEAGLFGHFQRESGLNALKQEDTAEKTGRGRVLLGRMFPPAKQIETRYTYLQKRPWLLPAAWVHRFIKTRDSLAEHVHEAKVIFSAEEEEVERLRRIKMQIGL